MALPLIPFFPPRQNLNLLLVGFIICGLSETANSQLSFTPNPNSAGNRGFAASENTTTPQTNLTPINSPAFSAPANQAISTNNPAAFDPYAINGQGMVPPVSSSQAAFGAPQTLPNGGMTNPSATGNNLPFGAAGNNPANSAFAQNGTSNPNTAAGSNRRGLFGLFSLPAAAPATYGNPNSLDNPSVYGPAGSATAGQTGTSNNSSYGPSAYPNSIYPQNSPNSLFPDGLGSAYSGGLLQNPSTNYNDTRLLQGARFRYGYVSPGSKPQHLGINDLDTSLAFAFPNFLSFNQPLYVIPSFSLHLWDGPAAAIAADLPSKAFDAFVDFGWETDPNKMVSADLGLRLGVFSDFETYTDRSFRVRGRALMNFRLTPTTSFRGGVYYVNRDEIKLIPGAGLLYRPDPYTQIDLYFPKPKYSRYYRTLGTSDLWWYITGDYGGGNWTVTRDNGIEESVDINDLRAILGIEWGPANALAAGRRSGFVEIGYVFNREVLYRTQQADNFDADDAFMFRLGIGY